MTKMKSKLRRTLSLVTALIAAQVTAFTSTDQSSKNHNLLQKNDIINLPTVLSEHMHIPQHQDYTFAVTEGVQDLPGFLWNNVSPRLDFKCESDKPLFMSITDEQKEFELMLGKALDTLRSDYPDMLTKTPDFSIYDSQVEVVDPKGITLHGLNSYKTSFQFLHMIIKLFYSPDDSGLTFRLVYDCARKSIRVSWNAVLIPRVGGLRNRLHVDGISVYEFDRQSGLINQHRVEHLLINDAPVEAPQGIFSAMRKHAMADPDVDGIPVFYTPNTAQNVLQFQMFSNELFGNKLSSSSLFSSSEGDFKHPLFDQEAFDKKNASRKKFGVKPLTPVEFVEIQAQVKVLEGVQTQKKIDQNAAAELEKAKEAKSNLFGKMFGNMFKDTCEDNFDCERPEICCDFGFKKMCCSSGMRVFDVKPQGGEMILQRVVADDGLNYPRGGPDGMDNYNNY